MGHISISAQRADRPAGQHYVDRYQGARSGGRLQDTDRAVSDFGGDAMMPTPPIHSRGFTLIEVLVTMLLLALVLPLVMNGITSASSTASESRRRNEAAGLAEEKLDEIIASQAWLNQTFLWAAISRSTGQPTGRTIGRITVGRPAFNPGRSHCRRRAGCKSAQRPMPSTCTRSI